MKKEEWIKGEISKWRSEGVVDGTTADALLARYKAAESRIGWGAIVAGSFGALLIELGVIALFAANWNYLGRAERAIVAIAPLLACGGAAIAAKARGWRTMAFWEPLGILWFISTIAATCLVAQTYNVGGKAPDLVMFVAVLTLPVVWITRSAVAMSVWPVLAFIYAAFGCNWWFGADASPIVEIESRAQQRQRSGTVNSNAVAIYYQRCCRLNSGISTNHQVCNLLGIPTICPQIHFLLRTILKRKQQVILYQHRIEAMVLARGDFNKHQ